MLAIEDENMEVAYDIYNRQRTTHDRREVSRAIRLAAEYRVAQLARQRTAKAIARVAAERKALKNSTGDEQQRAALTSATGAVAPDQ